MRQKRETMNTLIVLASRWGGCLDPV